MKSGIDNLRDVWTLPWRKPWLRPQFNGSKFVFRGTYRIASATAPEFVELLKREGPNRYVDISDLKTTDLDSGDAIVTFTGTADELRIPNLLSYLDKNGLGAKPIPLN